ncbi:MAG: TIGR00730 family Rossman fold protein [Pseudomonadota bacterium]
MTARSVCVFCGSRPGKNPAYMADAEAFGAIIARRNWRLVYGAGDVGLMGAVARSTQLAEGETFGVMPENLFDREIGKTDLTHYVLTETMHERKKVMFMNCDAVVVLPGGAGSLDEFFEVLTWRQIGLHQKPIFLLNTEGYWTKLVQLINHIIDEDFADVSLRDFMRVVEDVPALELALCETLS